MQENRNYFPVPMDDNLRMILGENFEKVEQARREAQANMIMGRTPEYAIHYRKGRGGKEYPYVKHSWVEAQLNLIFGWKWSFTILRETWGNNHIVVIGRLEVDIDGRVWHKDQAGGTELKRYTKTMYHTEGELKGMVKYAAGSIISPRDDLSSAASLAVTKCASYLGIGADVHATKEEIQRIFDPELQDIEDVF